MSNYDHKIIPNIKVQETINTIRSNTSRYYEILVITKEDEKPRIETTYNKIEIHIGNIENGPDLWHELTHVKMLTEQGMILHPYPKGTDNIQEYYAFTNIITNIVYDIYVDVELYFSHKEIDEEYYDRKYRAYCIFLNKNRRVEGLQEELQCAIIELIKEYCKVLTNISNRNIDGLKKYQDNSISKQRQEIEKWLNRTIFARQYEWISYHDLYLREKKVGVKDDSC
ncbi:MAG: hypothetical protein RSD97_08915 [Lachnospiraceae bacterium]